MRVSTAIGERPPTRSMTRACRNRSSLTCSGCGQVADFVEKQRAFMRLLDFADGGLHRPGEGALLVPEQLALEQVFGEWRRN